MRVFSATAGAVLLFSALTAATPASQPSRAGAGGAVDSMAVQPIECWWRTSANSVRVGEVFSVVLTCAVLDTSATTVVPDQSRLDPTVLQLPPFEVTGGAQAADLHTRSRRFLQYEYTLRYIGEDFGRDVALPQLPISYKVQSRVEQDAAAIESRDRQYILPSQAIRILSLVPASAVDIRDRAPDTFRDIAARRFRATVLRLIGLTLIALSAVIVLWALVRVLGRRRPHMAGATRLASDGAILRKVARELDAVRRKQHIDGWAPDVVARAQAALRIAGAYAVSGHVAQALETPGAGPSEGQLLIRPILRPGKAVLVSGSATAATVEREMRRRETLNGHRSGSLPDLQLALARLDAVAYRRVGVGQDDIDVDEAFASGSRAVDTIRREHRWIVRKLNALTRSVAGVRARAWAR